MYEKEFAGEISTFSEVGISSFWMNLRGVLMFSGDSVSVVIVNIFKTNFYELTCALCCSIIV